MAFSDDANILVVGSPGEDYGNGGVFVFRNNGSGYDEIALLQGSGNVGPAGQGQNQHPQHIYVCMWGADIYLYDGGRERES